MDRRRSTLLLEKTVNVVEGREDTAVKDSDEDSKDGSSSSLIPSRFATTPN